MSADLPTVYRKMSGPRGSIVSLEQLWAGDDHLLLVNSSFAVERYRRFYYHEIEALVIRPTTIHRRWIIVNSIFLAIFGGLTAFFARDPDEIGWAIFFGILGSFFLIGLLWQLVKGPTCRTFLQMRTGQERLAFANRVRAALKFRDRLAKLIGASAEARSVAPGMP